MNEVMKADRTIPLDSRLYHVSRVVKMDEDARRVTHVISSARLDRGGRYIEQSGWQLKEYRANNVVLGDHDYGIASIIGNGHDVGVVKDELMATTEFGPEGLGPLAFRLVQSGMAKAWSVGWQGVKGHPISQGVADACAVCEDLAGKTDWGYHYVKQALLEYSLVAVPANPDAVMRLEAAGFPISKRERDLWIESFGETAARAASTSVSNVPATETARAAEAAAAPDGAKADEVPAIAAPTRNPGFYAGIFDLTRSLTRKNAARLGVKHFGDKE